MTRSPRRPRDAAPEVSDELRDRARGALLGTFVGDALGMPHEGSPPSGIPRQLEMEEARLGRGTYTDDTEMAISLAESLLRCDVVDPEDLATALRVGADLRRGYGGGAVRVMELWKRGVPVALAARQLFEGQGSRGNGAAMRVAPVAVRFHDDEVMLDRQARRSAGVTHAHPEGIDGAAVQAAAIAAAMNDADVFADALEAAETTAMRAALEGEGDRGGIPPVAAASVAAAVQVASRAREFEEAVVEGIRLGGDTDTVGAMAGAIAGARWGAAGIPHRWIDVLEDGPRGRAHVIALADALIERAVRPVTGTGLGR